MKEEGQIYQMWLRILVFAQRLSMIFQSLVIISPLFFDFERP